jgi:hypothetical protein
VLGGTALSPDEGDLLGGLPRSRPGERSPKRAQRSARTQGRSARVEPPARAASPLTGAARLAVDAAGAGAKLATGVAGGLLRRLSRLGPR